MDSVGFISSLGGLFGLFLGFSLISFIELFYWIIIKLPRRLTKYVKELVFLSPIYFHFILLVAHSATQYKGLSVCVSFCPSVAH